MAGGDKIKDISSLKQFTPLDRLESERLAELAEGSQLHKLSKGQSVSAVTEKNQSAYLLSGEVTRAPGAANAERIKAGSPRSRQALISPSDRNRVVAESDVSIVCVDTDTLDFLLSWGNSEGLVVDEIEIESSDAAGWVDSLMQSEVVLNLAPSSIQALIAAVEPAELAAGSVVFKQGDAPDYYYIISRGECTVSTGSNPKLATLRPGDAFGEEALITNAPRGATVTMETAGVLLRLDRNNFKKLLEQPLIQTTSAEEAERLKQEGAIIIDVRPASEFARDGKGSNIPFNQLRAKLHTLDGGRHYLIYSDDNRISAVAAFLVAQKQLKVSVMPAPARPEAAAKPPQGSPPSSHQSSHQARELQSFSEQLQRELEETRQRLAAEQRLNANSRERIQTLEKELNDTQKTARSAIVEASVLKNKSESMLRNRIGELGNELEALKQSHEALNDEYQRLKRQLAGSQSGTEAADLQKRVDQLRNDNQTLQDRLKELEQLSSQQSRRLQENETHLSQTGRERDTLQQQSSGLQTRIDELQTLTSQQSRELKEGAARLEETGRERDSLQQQLTKLQQQTIEQRQQLDALEQSLDQTSRQLQNTTMQFERSEKVLASLQQEHDGLRRKLEESQEAREAAKEQIKGLDLEIRSLNDALEQARRDSKSQAQAAQQTQESLNKQLHGLKTHLLEKNNQIKVTDSEHKRERLQFESQIKKAQSDIEKFKEAVSNEQLRNSILSKENAKLQDDHRRSRIITRLIIALIVVILVVAHFMGVDFVAHGKTAIDSIRETIDKLLLMALG